MTEQAISPLRRRMIEDMSIRRFAAKTQHDYVQRVKDFATFLGRSPDKAEAEDVRRFRLHLSRTVQARRRSTPPSRRCGSFSRLRLIAPTSAGTCRPYMSRARSRLC